MYEIKTVENLFFILFYYKYILMFMPRFFSVPPSVSLFSIRPFPPIPFFPSVFLPHLLSTQSFSPFPLDLPLNLSNFLLYLSLNLTFSLRIASFFLPFVKNLSSFFPTRPLYLFPPSQFPTLSLNLPWFFSLYLPSIFTI